MKKQKTYLNTLLTIFRYTMFRPLRKKTLEVFKKDTNPHSISMGLSVGLFIGLLPIMGFQIIPALFVSSLFRINSVACIAAVWISNPLTVVPIYLFNYWVGTFFFTHSSIIKISEFKAIIIHMNFNIILDRGLFTILPLFIGSLIVATTTSIASYFIFIKLSKGFIERFQKKKSISKN